MTPDHWEQIRILFEAALEKNASDRVAFLAQCPHAELVREVEELLKQHDKLGTVASFGVSDQFISNVSRYVLSAGDLINGRYRIIRFVGRGGMGEVYEAQDIELNLRIALKTLRDRVPTSGRSLERFKREILIGRKISHPNVCRVFDLGRTVLPGREDLFYLTMEFIPGQTLSSRLHDRGPVPPVESFALVRQIVDGLAACHRCGVLHRDLKCSNIMLVQDTGSQLRALITDFGLAHDAVIEDATLSLPGEVRGTPGYIAPEVMQGYPATKASDIFALGVVICEMLTGHMPGVPEPGMRTAGEACLPPNDLSPQWKRVILGCIQPDPGNRFQTTSDVLAELEEGDDQVTTAVPGSGSLPSKHSWLREHWRGFSLGLAGLICSLIAVWWIARVIPRHAALPAQRRVAVLGFENIGAEKSNEAFCQGLRETVTNKLTQLESFQGALSIVPASELRGRGTMTVREAQREFGVNLAITGSVEQSDAGVRVAINLIDARALKQLRAKDSFVRRDELPKMEDAVVQDVAYLLDMELRPEARKAISEQGTTASPGAYGYYLQGYGYLHASYTATDQAITEFQLALKADDKYALAYAGLGEAYWNKYLDTKDISWIDKAWASCRKALSLNPNIAPVRTTLAMLYAGTGKYEDSIREADAALAIDPRNPDANAAKAKALEGAGRIRESEELLKQTIQLRPDLWEGYYELGDFYYKYGDYGKAERSFQHVVELVPDNAVGYANLGSTYYAQGRRQEAEAELLKSLKIKPTAATYSNLATLYFFEGRFAEAARIDEQQAKTAENSYTIWTNLGDAYRWTPALKSKAPAAYRKAVALADAAVQVNPKDSDALSTLGICHAKLGDMRAAMEYTRRAVRIAPDDRDVLYAAAIVYEIEGDRKMAIQYLHKAKQLGYTEFEILNDPELRNLRQDRAFAKR